MMAVGIPPGWWLIPFCIPICYKYDHYWSNWGEFVGSSVNEEV